MDVPNEPSTAVGNGAVLPPRTEVLAAADALPTSAYDRKVELPEQNMLLLASEAVSEIGLVDVAIMNTQALPVVPQRSALRREL